MIDHLDILTFSGWTQPADALHGIVPKAQGVDYAQAPSVEAVADMLPTRQVDLVVGWSLGGVIARQLMAKGALQAKALVSIGAPFQFVRDDRMQAAMPVDTFEQFYQNYQGETARTAKRFHGLVAKGDVDARRVMEALSHHPQVLEAGKWLPWLDYLRHYSADAYDYDTVPPTLIIHGKSDQIIPFAQGEALSRHLPQAQLFALEGCAHAPHLHDGARVRQAIEVFWSHFA